MKNNLFNTLWNKLYNNYDFPERLWLEYSSVYIGLYLRSMLKVEYTFIILLQYKADHFLERIIN